MCIVPTQADIRQSTHQGGNISWERFFIFRISCLRSVNQMPISSGDKWGRSEKKNQNTCANLAHTKWTQLTPLWQHVQTLTLSWPETLILKGLWYYYQLLAGSKHQWSASVSVCSDKLRTTRFMASCLLQWAWMFKDHCMWGGSVETTGLSSHPLPPHTALLLLVQPTCATLYMKLVCSLWTPWGFAHKSIYSKQNIFLWYFRLTIFSFLKKILYIIHDTYLIPQIWI